MVLLSGEADLVSVPELTSALGTATGSGAKLVTVDLSGLMFADSASFRVLIVADRAQRSHGGTLQLVGPQPAIARALTLLGIDQVLNVRTAAPGGGGAGD